METIIGTYDRREAVADVVARLEAAGVPTHHVAVLDSAESNRFANIVTAARVPRRTVGGALLAAAVGSVLLLGLAVLVLTLLDRSLTPLPALLLAAIGAVAGGYYGALYGTRAADHEPLDIKNALDAGNAAVLVRAERIGAAAVARIMRRRSGATVSRVHIDRQLWHDLP